MSVHCTYCGERMTSAPSHMDHERACEKNPKNEILVLRSLLAESYYALREPANGVHYCRGCDAGTHNAWKHGEHCPVNLRSDEVRRLRSRIRELIGDPAAYGRKDGA